jgi:(p)ppGpp synthase/HD superfamily hydrolase
MHVSFVSMEVMAALLHEPEQDGNLAVQCALLHDVIEDTGVSYEDVKDVFGTAEYQPATSCHTCN